MSEHKSKSAAGKVSASASKMGPMKHNFSRIEIHPAANGYTVMHHKPMPEGKDRYAMPMSEPDQTVFGGEDAQGQMLNHLGSILGSGKSPGNKSAKTASGKESAADKASEGKNEPAESESED